MRGRMDVEMKSYHGKLLMDIAREESLIGKDIQELAESYAMLFEKEGVMTLSEKFGVKLRVRDDGDVARGRPNDLFRVEFEQTGQMGSVKNLVGTDDPDVLSALGIAGEGLEALVKGPVVVMNSLMLDIKGAIPRYVRNAELIQNSLRSLDELLQKAEALVSSEQASRPVDVDAVITALGGVQGVEKVYWFNGTYAVKIKEFDSELEVSKERLDVTKRLHGDGEKLVCREVVEAGFSPVEYGTPYTRYWIPCKLNGVLKFQTTPANFMVFVHGASGEIWDKHRLDGWPNRASGDGRLCLGDDGSAAYIDSSKSGNVLIAILGVLTQMRKLNQGGYVENGIWAFRFSVCEDCGKYNRAGRFCEDCAFMCEVCDLIGGKKRMVMVPTLPIDVGETIEMREAHAGCTRMCASCEGRMRSGVDGLVCVMCSAAGLDPMCLVCKEPMKLDPDDPRGLRKVRNGVDGKEEVRHRRCVVVCEECGIGTMEKWGKSLNGNEATCTNCQCVQCGKEYGDSVDGRVSYYLVSARVSVHRGTCRKVCRMCGWWSPKKSKYCWKESCGAKFQESGSGVREVDGVEPSTIIAGALESMVTDAQEMVSDIAIPRQERAQTLEESLNIALDAQEDERGDGDASF